MYNYQSASNIESVQSVIAAARIEEEVYGGTPGREARRFELPGVSRLPNKVDPNQNFMNLRTRGNRSGLQSLERTRGLGIGGIGGARRGYHN